MEITVEYHDLKLRCKIEYVYPTFEDEYLYDHVNFYIQNIYVQDSDIDIYDLLNEQIEEIDKLISEQL
jgi:hypothetical protein